MSKPNRNELCPCGSGRKNKKCCGAAEATTGISRGVLLALAPVALLAGVGIYAAFSGPAEPQTASAAPARAPLAAPAAAPVQPAASQPTTAQPGPAPAGQVWSAEHNHFHDAPTAATPSPIKIDMNMNNPAVSADGTAIRIDGKALEAAANEMRLPGQPDGPAPAGKVWSTEHSHWHDKPSSPPPTVHLGNVNRPSSPVPAPGPAPAGMVWSAEHGHWHKAQ